MKLMTNDKLIRPSRRAVLGMGAATLASPFLMRAARAQSGAAGRTIGFSQSYGTDEWLKAQRQDVLSTAEAKGMNVIATDARESPAQEIRNLEDLAVQGVDAVIMITYYVDSVGPGIEALNNVGIPIIVMSSALAEGQDFTSHLAADTYGTAQNAGDYYGNALDGSGKVVHIQGRPGSVVSQARGNGWKDKLASDYPGIEIVAEGIGNYSRSEALALMEDYLRSNAQIDAVYCHNDNMAKGALQAIEEAGRTEEMFITGYDGIAPETFQMILERRLRGTFLYPTFGGEAVEVAARVLEGGEVPKEIVFKSPMITADNVGEFYDAETQTRRSPKVDLKAIGL
jgi:ribose transport system substrate-binding protein